MKAPFSFLFLLAFACVAAAEYDRNQEPDCSGGTCKCYDEDGETIEESDELTTCTCVFDRNEAQKSMVVGSYIPQCNADGSYQKFQCFNSIGACFCVTGDGGYLKRADDPEECE